MCTVDHTDAGSTTNKPHKNEREQKNFQSSINDDRESETDFGSLER